uniref:Uncharacterized protein n=1 Tax=Anguilla anguilla TaxID=7936 RepID=A0A0E9UZ74_ANGAN
MYFYVFRGDGTFLLRNVASSCKQLH